MLVGSHLRVQYANVRGTALGTGLYTNVLNFIPWRDAGREKNRFTGGAMSLNAAVPFGYLPPDVYLLPLRAGGMSSSQLLGLGGLSGAAAGGRNGEATLSGSGDLSATGQLIVSAVATLVGSGAIDNADCKAYLNAAATLAGDGNLTGAAIALGFAAAELAGSAGANVTLRAEGELGAAITVAGEGLTAASVASAVWETPQGRFLYAIGHNRVVTDPAAGTYTVYDTDDTTVLYTADLWEDADGTVPYTGTGAQRRDRLT